MSNILVDPKVSQTKFNREIQRYRGMEDEYIRRGWWMVKSEFPMVFVVFGNAKGLVKTVVFGVSIDFTNYDLWPPSVKLADPFTMQPYRAKELPYPLLRRIPAPAQSTTTVNSTVRSGADGRATHCPTNPKNVSEAVQSAVVETVPLMQAWDPEDVPFLCLPGVREYHENPAHTGDAWLLHRGGGEGTLHFILEQLYKYGVQPLRLGVQVQLAFQTEGIPL